MAADKLTEEQTSESLKTTIAKLSVNVGRAVPAASPTERVSLSCALNLLTQAQIIADTQPNMARMLYSQARRLASVKDNGRR